MLLTTCGGGARLCLVDVFESEGLLPVTYAYWEPRKGASERPAHLMDLPPAVVRLQWPGSPRPKPDVLCRRLWNKYRWSPSPLALTARMGGGREWQRIANHGDWVVRNFCTVIEEAEGLYTLSFVSWHAAQFVADWLARYGTSRGLGPSGVEPVQTVQLMVPPPWSPTLPWPEGAPTEFYWRAQLPAWNAHQGWRVVVAAQSSHPRPQRMALLATGLVLRPTAAALASFETAMGRAVGLGALGRVLLSKCRDAVYELPEEPFWTADDTVHANYMSSVQHLPLSSSKRALDRGDDEDDDDSPSPLKRRRLTTALPPPAARKVPQRSALKQPDTEAGQCRAQTKLAFKPMA